MYEISPSTLKMALDDKFSCHRCFWLKVKYNVRPPQMEGLGAFLRRTHSLFFQYWSKYHIPGLPVRGKLISCELEVRSKPVLDTGIVLWGYLDGLIDTPHDGYCIVDLKTTQNTDWVVKNYSLQLNTYAYCVEHSELTVEQWKPIDIRRGVNRLGIITFTDYRFGSKSLMESGIVGELKWHECPKGYDQVVEACQRAADILSLDTPPRFKNDCEWCTFYKEHGEFVQEEYLQ